MFSLFFCFFHLKKGLKIWLLRIFIGDTFYHLKMLEGKYIRKPHKLEKPQQVTKYSRGLNLELP